MQRLTRISLRYFQTSSIKRNLICGKTIGERILNECRKESREFFERYQRSPKLFVVQVGGNESSKLYVRNKQRVAEDVGIEFHVIHHLLHTSPSTLLTTIEKLNEDETIDGIVLQLPLPLHLIEKTDVFIDKIRADKDVDGHSRSNYNLFRNETSKIVTIPVVDAVREILLDIGEPLHGKEIVVIGRSKYVGTPLALMLSQSSKNSLIAGATVTICHRETHPNNLSSFCRNADVIISAVGRAKLVTHRMVKPASVVIDVGISKSWTEETTMNIGRRFVGDVDFHEVKHVAKWITPVPGGVGPVTVACLMRNILRMAQQRNRID